MSISSRWSVLFHTNAGWVCYLATGWDALSQNFSTHAASVHYNRHTLCVCVCLRKLFWLNPPGLGPCFGKVKQTRHILVDELALDTPGLLSKGRGFDVREYSAAYIPEIAGISEL